MPDLENARRVLRDVMQHPGFREGQAEVIGRLLEGRSVLAIFPTGGGKSLCYQLPALLFDGLTIVVSPLIALMKDQVDALARQGILATRLDSSQSVEETRQAYENVRSGRTRLLYVAPERLGSERFLRSLGGRKIAMVAIDEAHCISEWGHNFRPEYMKLAALATKLQAGRVLALTATATPSIAIDIARAFRIDDADVVRSNFHRPNLELHASPCCLEDRRSLLLARLRSARPVPTIVYVTQQKTAEELAQFLTREGFAAEAYHAGLGPERRVEVQERFMGPEAGIVVATIAFGMGIDKADIRAVYHYNLPKSLENYAQEIGRAGRDGQPAHCELFACSEDVTTLENFTYGDTPTIESTNGFLKDILSRGPRFEISIYDLSFDHDIRQIVIETILTYLEMDGILEGTGTTYAEYKFRPIQPIEAILSGPRGPTYRSLNVRAKAGRIWYSIDLKEPGPERLEVAGLLAELELSGDIEVQAKGIRRGYRWLELDPDVDRICREISQRFLLQERRNVERVRQVTEFASLPGCLTRHLLDYFGQAMSTVCGHCSRCLSGIPPVVEAILPRSLDEEARTILSELRGSRFHALASPRQEARFLCGITSPATTKARLGKHPIFGVLADIPFERVLAFVEGRIS
ncbi:RecQ family ATP-dependent DNA helicase [Tundrisphaera lichenicola]|uniref:RecQ family ATP-dependent DNA helicase n=1 Tax=Tundrisphaera lichenicola TaxID=2029860 RepID=UPI003EBDB61D